jgi:hypothetical protein
MHYRLEYESYIFCSSYNREYLMLCSQSYWDCLWVNLEVEGQCIFTLFIKDKKVLIILMMFVMGFDIPTVLFVKSWGPWDVVLCHWAHSACLTGALRPFSTWGTMDPATQHNITWFFMINSGTTSFTSWVQFRKVNHFIICFSVILPVAYHTSYC